MRNPVIVRLFLVPFAVGFGTLLSGCDLDPVPATVTIGVVGSGNFVNAARLAIEDEYAAGGLPAFDTIMIPEGSNRAEPALRYAQELAAHPGIVAVIGHSNSAASIAASQVYNQNGILQIAPTSTAILYREAGPYSFRLVSGDDAQARFLARTLADSLPSGARLAILYVNDDYGRGLQRSLYHELEESNLEVALSLPHLDDGVEGEVLEHLQESLSAASPDAIVWLGRTHGLDSALPVIRERLGPVPIYGSDGTSTARDYHPDDLWSPWAGVYMVDLLEDTPSPERAAFYERFRERFEGTGVGSAEALFYDATRLVLWGLREGARDGEALRELMNALGDTRPAWPGLTGEIRFSDEGDGFTDFVLTRYPEPEPR